MASLETIETLIQRRIVVLHLHSPAQQAARAMCDRNVGSVIVADRNGHLAGIVTDRDLTCSLLARDGDSQTPLSDIMTPQVTSVSENASIDEVLNAMEQTGARRIPVVRSAGDSGSSEGAAKGAAKAARHCVGIITLDDLLAAGLVNPERITRIIRAQISRPWPWTHPSDQQASDQQASGQQASPVEGQRRWSAQLRSEAHREQTLNHFYHVIAGLLEGEPREKVADFSQFILSSLVRRLHCTGAAHLIAQLPRNLQEDLLDLPAGPDRSVSVPSLLNGIMNGFAVTDAQSARRALVGFFRALHRLINPAEIENIQAQLPIDFREVLTEARNSPNAGNAGKTAA